GSRVAEGWAAPFAYIALYVIGTVVLAPSPLMSIAAGVAFGWWGVPLAVVAATAGATVSFLIGRYFLNDDLEDWLTERRIFRAANTRSTKRVGGSRSCCGSVPRCPSDC